MLVSFTLTMPNCGSWNGRWSGEKDLYVRVRKYNKEMINKFNILEKLENDFRYNFGDGWCASVYLEKVDSKEANTLRKRSRGFSGYDWMIDSILKNGKIVYEEE